MSATTKPDSPAPFSSVTARLRPCIGSRLSGVVLGICMAITFQAFAQTLADPVAAVGTNSNPLLMLIALLPPPYAGYAVSALSIITTVITVASIITAAFPAPTTTSGAWYWTYTVVNKLAINFGHGQSLAAPGSAGIVGGAGATTTPKLATAVVPLATATVGQKAMAPVPPVAS